MRHFASAVRRSVLLTLPFLLTACISGPYGKGWGEAGDIHRAAWESDPEAITKAIANGEDPNRAATIPYNGFPKQDGEFRETPMSLAIHNNKPESVRTLVEHGATVTTSDLLRAASRNTESTKEVLAAGVDVNSSAKVFNLTTETALHVAAKQSNINTCKVLLAAGADINARDSDGNTPLHVVVAHIYLSGTERQRQNRLAAAELLLASAADKTLLNAKGKTPQQSVQYWQGSPPDDRLNQLFARYAPPLP